MRSITRALLLLTFSFLFFHGSDAQTIDELIESHKENLERLYEARGIPDLAWWKTGRVWESDLIKVLRDFRQEVGILIYTHRRDSLQVVLLDKSGKKVSTKIGIQEDSLVNLVATTNSLFSRGFQSRAPAKRGTPILKDFDTEDAHRTSIDALSKMLIPIHCDTLKQFDHLIIVPVLNISITPFSALKLCNEEYLIDVLSYSIAPSLFEIMVSAEMKKNRGFRRSGLNAQYAFNKALFVANPSFPTDSAWSFPSLPGTQKEVNYITGKLDSSRHVILSGEDATLSRIMQSICDCDLLYFATHGISQDENPLHNSFLVLAESEEGSFLRAQEIQDLRKKCSLKADLVVLSACQTGLGQSHKGGMIGISRAFQIAGANHILMSLWSIDDEQTAIQMGLFFDNLMLGGQLMPHEALRQAILQYKKDIRSEPRYWAAFSIFGSPY